MRELDKKTKALSEKEEKVNKLIEAARNGHLAACKMLAKAGADLSVADGEGRTALESAKGSALRSWLAERHHAADGRAVRPAK